MSTPKQILVLGAGRVGSAIALDLAAGPEFAVTAADLDPRRAERFASEPGLRFQAADLGTPAAVAALVAPFDLVVGAVPGWMGYATVRAALEAGKDVVDISFFEQDPFTLDALAKERGVTAVVDCGVAPGLSNLVLGRWQEEFERIDVFTCLVGGLPQDPQPPWNYKAPYSPADVIEMYTRPARIVRGGAPVTVPALTEPEELEFEGVGRLEAFNTDGLRTLLTTTSIPELKEKTLRYPGHREQVELLAATGFLDDSREVDGTVLRPRELSSKLLFAEWHQGEGDHDVTVMRLEAEGMLDGRRVRRTWDLVDRYDVAGGISSMARTTGYPCASIVRSLLAGRIDRKGVLPPEHLGSDAALFDSVLADLDQRSVRFERSEVELVP